ncbi:MAG: two-component system response regulator NarL, partial [Candidatus Competibacteraceae bacterium]|nr:two-component system response regulator NarL [Candidatus Competibacteraceae bacterium]
IARKLNITEGTVKVHVKHLLRKLDLASRVEAAVWAVKQGFHA